MKVDEDVDEEKFQLFDDEVLQKTKFWRLSSGAHAVTSPTSMLSHMN